MTRIDELDFPHTAALYRGDRHGVAVIRRNVPVDAGPTWAVVVEPGAGIEPGHLFIQYHAGEAHVWAVEGTADAKPPREAHLDARLSSVGAFFEQADVAASRRAADDLYERSEAQSAAVRANTFTVQTTLDGHAWEVSVSPTVQGETTLVLSRMGTIRHLVTSVPRADLERARTVPVPIEATETVGRPWFDLRTGRTHRTVTLTLTPAGLASEAPA